MVKELRLERFEIVKRGLKSSQEVTKDTTRCHYQLKTTLLTISHHFEPFLTIWNLLWTTGSDDQSKMVPNWFESVQTGPNESEWVPVGPNRYKLVRLTRTNSFA